MRKLVACRSAAWAGAWIGRSAGAALLTGLIGLWAGEARAQTCCAGAGTTCHLVGGWPACSGTTGCVTLAVQLNRFSNGSFQTAIGDAVTDLVIVGTYYTDQGGSCPGGQNRIYGIRSSNLTTKWVYNQTGSVVLNEVTEACPLEYYSGS